MLKSIELHHENAQVLRIVLPCIWTVEEGKQCHNSSVFFFKQNFSLFSQAAEQGTEAFITVHLNPTCPGTESKNSPTSPPECLGWAQWAEGEADPHSWAQPCPAAGGDSRGAPGNSGAAAPPEQREQGEVEGSRSSKSPAQTCCVNKGSPCPTGSTRGAPVLHPAVWMCPEPQPNPGAVTVSLQRCLPGAHSACSAGRLP